MSERVLIYGATGFVGSEIARLAARQGLAPVLSGRSEEALRRLGEELGLEHRIARLDDPVVLDRALEGVGVLLNCAGPFRYTYRPLVAACLRAGAHYLDITGEIDVFEGIASFGDAAEERGLMLLPGAGFDVVPTDCLALHLRHRLPHATRLTIAIRPRGPAGAPPGTLRTAIEILPRGILIRRDGRVIRVPTRAVTQVEDFGEGPVPAVRFTWGDIFTAYYSTGIPNIETYLVIPSFARRLLPLMGVVGPVLRAPGVSSFLKARVSGGSTPEERARSSTHIVARVEDDSGNRAAARLHGPEAGVVWTAAAALTAVRVTLAGNAVPGFQTPGRAFGPDFGLDIAGVTREDLD